MKEINISKNIFDAKEFLEKGKPAVILTDTLYGILANALDKNSVEYVYNLKGRKKDKPFIILIPSTDYLKIFGIEPNNLEKDLLNTKGITVVLNLDNEKFSYLHREKKSLAFRIPKKENLLKLLENLKLPLIAPSCNPEGKKPAESVKEAINYFGDKIPIYINEGVCKNVSPSTIVRVENNEIKILRRGQYKIPFNVNKKQS